MQQEDLWAVIVRWSNLGKWTAAFLLILFFLSFALQLYSICCTKLLNYAEIDIFGGNVNYLGGEGDTGPGKTSGKSPGGLKKKPDGSSAGQSGGSGFTINHSKARSAPPVRRARRLSWPGGPARSRAHTPPDGSAALVAGDRSSRACSPRSRGGRTRSTCSTTPLEKATSTSELRGRCPALRIGNELREEIARDLFVGG